MEEKEIAVPIIAWLEEQHWDVYQEVNFNRSTRADIVAVRDNKLWIIETKTSFTLSVLEQAHRWPSDFRSIGVPRAKREDRNFAYSIASYLKLGVIEVSGNYVDEVQNAPFMRINHGFAKQMMLRLYPEHKTSLMAGSKGGGYFTPYKQTMDRVRRFINQHPGCTIKEIYEDIGRGHYSSGSSAKSCIRIALASWEKDWCESRLIGREFHYFIKEANLE
jgi:hypothetical protein